ncbi:anhydro-N-acetylmuramic acid kinase [Gammaproteobacteria bacterium]|nr:anhydro-N-acetylmuramic acid kinase [Gammaproteobacteria bacterium]
MGVESELYIGLISGTSMDAIDCALVDFQATQPKLLDFLELPIPLELKATLLNLCGDGQNQIEALGTADVMLAKLFSQAALTILKRNQLSTDQIIAIGSHGQTIRHQPPHTTCSLPFTIQISDPSTIAELTNITTVADFRSKDIAAGGQGAPLVPAFHRQIFQSSNADRIILNIGGMSNITLLKKNSSDIIGYDTGPGNVLMDTWIKANQNKDFDENGQWASIGNTDQCLLKLLLDENYFRLAAPKSTGRELFNELWLKNKLQTFDKTLQPEDIQATLLELTAETICNAIRAHLLAGEIIVCGGGARNTQLMNTLQHKLKNFTVMTSTEFGIDGDSIEAIAFAWLAQQAIKKKPIDFTNITGASHPVIMGGIYFSENQISI